MPKMKEMLEEERRFACKRVIEKNFNDITSEEIADFENNPDPELMIHFQPNDEGEIPFNEIGYGENVGDDIEKEKFHKDKEEICSIIQKKRWEAFGTENSPARLSCLSPVKVDLKKGAPTTIQANPMNVRGLEQQEYMVQKVMRMLELDMQVEPFL